MTIFAFKIMDRKDRRAFGLAGNELSTQYLKNNIISAQEGKFYLYVVYPAAYVQL